MNNEEISFYDLYLHFLNGVKKSYKTLTILLLIVSAISVYKFMNKQIYYKQDVVIKSKYLRTTDMSYIFKNLTELIKKKNYKKLAEELNIKIEHAKLIDRLNFEAYSSNINVSGAVITFYFYKGVGCDVFKNALDTYLNNVEYIVTIREGNKRKYEGIINTIKYELNALEEILEGVEVKGENIEGFVRKTKVVMDLEIEKEEAQHELMNDIPVIIVQSFCDDVNSAGPHIITYITLTIAIFVILSIFVVFFTAGFIKSNSH